MPCPSSVPTEKLPDYKSPPVVEIIAAVQFVPLPQFGMAEAITVARAFDDYSVVDVPAALPPIVEARPGEPARQSFRLDLGSPPVRLILASRDERWLIQLQQDRIAVHERRLKNRPSFKHVRPQMRRVAKQASTALGRELLGKASHPPELVELIYENRIAAGKGWTTPADLHKVLRVLAAPGPRPDVPIEQVSVAFSSHLNAGGDFVGRLHVRAEPQIELQAGAAQIHLQLISHRYSRQRAVTTVLNDCHRDIVDGFTAVTTPEMHKVWERYQ